MKLFDRLRGRFRDLCSRPIHKMTRAERATRYGMDLTRHCARKLYDDGAAQMAAALSYRTIFGLVPLLVLALIVFRAFGGFQDMGERVQEAMYRYLGVSTITIQQPAAPSATASSTQAAATAVTPRVDQAHKPSAPTTAAARAGAGVGEPSSTQASRANGRRGPPASEKAQMRTTLEQSLEKLNEQVSKVSFSSIGAVGLVLLIWAALSLVISVEDCFNVIYNTGTGRSWMMRITVYWATITLGPVLLMVSLWAAGQLTWWVDHLTAVPTGASGMYYALTLVVRWVVDVLSRFTALAATWLLLFLLYVLMPNTKVHLRPAAIGSLVAGILWEIGKWGFGLYVRHAVGYSALYGSLGLIPLFLLWIYLSWLIVLFGIELTYTLQAMPGRRFKSLTRRQAQQVLIDPWWLVSVMALVGERFAVGKAAHLEQVTERTGLPIRVVRKVMQQLQEAGFLHRIEARDEEDPGFVLAKAPGQVALAQVIQVGQDLAMEQAVTAEVPGGALIDRLRRTPQEAARDTTLADVLADVSAEGGDGGSKAQV